MSFTEVKSLNDHLSQITHHSSLIIHLPFAYSPLRLFSSSPILPFDPFCFLPTNSDIQHAFTFSILSPLQGFLSLIIHILL